MENESRSFESPKRILVFRIGHLGDTIVALPAFWALRESFPKSTITLLSNTDPGNPNYVSTRDVLPETGLFDEWMSYPSGGNALSAYGSRFKLLFELRRRRFDLAFYLMTRNRTREQIDRDIRFFRLAGIRRICGINHLRGNLLPLPIPTPLEAVDSETDFLLETLRSEGLAIDPKKHELALTERERMSANDHVVRFNTRGPLIAVAPGSKWASKMWSREKFAEVVKRLIHEFGVFPVVFGGANEKELGNFLIDQWRTGSNVAGKLRVRESAALLERCDLFVGNDSGVMHLAAAVNIPCVAIFSAVDRIGRWTPFGGERNCIFRSRVECEGCHSADCHNNHKCLELISSDEVFEACAQIIARHHSAAISI